MNLYIIQVRTFYKTTLSLKMTLRWGIASAGKISFDFLVGLSTLPATDHLVIAIAASDLSRAENYAKTFKIPNAYGSYEQLAKDPNIDIVYIGVLNPQHFETSMLMLQNNKHVLCEKPLCVNVKQSKILIDFAQEKKLFLMEGVWSRFFPTYKYLKKQLSEGALGEINTIDVSFGADLKTFDRLHKKDLGGGTVLDLGIYTIQLCQWIFKEAPKLIKASGELNPDNVDIAMQATLQYSNGAIANIRTSSIETLRNTAIIKGTKGVILIPNFWCPTSLIDVDGTEKQWPLPETNHKTNFTNSVGLRYEAEAIRLCINVGATECDDMNHNESILIGQIEDEIRQQIGVVYDADK